MQLRSPGALLALTTLLAMPVVSCGGGTPPPADLFPFRDGWVTEVDAEFPYLDGEGAVQITSVIVGGREFNDNFANRGDVVVKFDGEEGRIKVELRRFTFAESESEAKNDYAKLVLWAFATSVSSPKQPGDMMADDNCVTAGWQNGCGVRVWYDGLQQPSRLGADIRVTLPPSYRDDLIINTEDNVQEDAYQDRGNVCVSGINGTVDADLESGVAYVWADAAVTPGPTCTAAEIDSCETWMDTEGNPAAWAADCPCQEFGQIKVESSNSGAANITVDVPGTIWASMTLDNNAETLDAAACTSSVTVPGATIDPVHSDKSWRESAEINHPSDAAIAGGGFNVRGASDDCAPILFAESPSDYPGEGNKDDQDSELRGNVTVCDGCIRGMSCEDLLPSTR